MKKNRFEWAVIGAGPAGIAAIGNLLDRGITPKEILWIDPHFNVGDIGALWNSVSSNTSVELFFDYFNFCESFEFKKAPLFEINQLKPDNTCQLKFIMDPLKWITSQLREKVYSTVGFVKQISMFENHWRLEFQKQQGEYLAQKVILSIGAKPKSLAIENIQEIPIDIGLNKKKLRDAVKNMKRVAVFGSSHTAVILIRDLLELGLEVDNYYQEALRYAVFFEDWVLFDDTGLKGETAQWARKNLHGSLPKGLNRYLSSPKALDSHLKNVQAALYAIGFKRRPFHIEGLPFDFCYNPHCGIIAPGIFGTGIAFPEYNIDRYGHHESRVGLWKFIEYTQRVLPLWMNYGL